MFHLVIDEGLQLAGLGGEDDEEEFVVDLEGHAGAQAEGGTARAGEGDGVDLADSEEDGLASAQEEAGEGEVGASELGAVEGADDKGQRVVHIDWRLAAACFVPNSGAVFIRHRQLTIPSRGEQWQCVCGSRVAQRGRAGDEGAAGGLAERDSGGSQADTGGGGAVAGRESAEGLGAEGVQAGGLLGGAADALRYGAAT